MDSDKLESLLDLQVFMTCNSHDFSERGIFFRWPFQKVNKDGYGSGECFDWYDRAKRWFFPRLYNWRVFKMLPEWSKSDNFAGVNVIEMCSPIYFDRVSRKAFYTFYNHNISSIEVYGYEPYKNHCAGAAEKEIARFTLEDGTTYDIVTRGKFHYTYQHTVEQEFYIKTYEDVLTKVTKELTKFNQL